MHNDYYFFTPLSLWQVITKFPEWEPDFAAKAHDNWLGLFNKRAGFLYSTQLSNHYESLQRQFCREHDLPYVEDIREYGYQLAFDAYKHEYGYSEHYSECNLHMQQLKNSWDNSHPNREIPVVTARELADEFLARLTSTVLLPDSSYVEELIMSIWFNTVISNSREEAGLLRKLPYSEYLKTPHWRRVRSAMILAHGARCQHERCDGLDSYWAGGESQLNVHHLSYKNRGNERFEDLTLLCEECHKLEHGIKEV